MFLKRFRLGIELEATTARLDELKETIVRQEKRLPREKEKAEVRERLQQFAE